MEKVKIRQIKATDNIDLSPEFWEMLRRIPKFPKVNGITQIRYTS